jgi:hypothetical protein
MRRWPELRGFRYLRLYNVRVRRGPEGFEQKAAEAAEIVALKDLPRGKNGGAATEH